jgi:hypothetical protein
VLDDVTGRAQLVQALLVAVMFRRPWHERPAIRVDDDAAVLGEGIRDRHPAREPDQRTECGGADGAA